MGLILGYEEYEELAASWEQHKRDTLKWLSELGYTPETYPIRLAHFTQPNPYSGGPVTQSFVRRMDRAYMGKVPFAQKYGKRIYRR